MTLVVDKFRTLIPPRARSNPSGWTSFNSPCCHHRGHNRDTKSRGGLRFDSGIIFNCFNCKFTAGWQPGRLISEKFKNLCRWMGASDTDIQELVFEALKTESPDYEYTDYIERVTFDKKELPEGALPLRDWYDIFDQIPEDLQLSFVEVIAYVTDRGHDPYSKMFYWTPLRGFESRVIIPFFYQKQIVGYTARKITDGRPKYLSEQHPHFVFNVDEQKDNQRYVLVCEGPFDAISVNGVALLTNSIGDQQARILDSLGSEIIVVPDQDKAGLALIDKAIHYNFSVAFPNWGDDVKDAADAVKKYGKLFVVVDAIKTAQHGEVKIKIAKKQLEKKLLTRDSSR